MDIIKWKNVKQFPLPKDEKDYLGLYKGQFCIFTYEEDKNIYSMCWMPSVYDHTWSIEEEMWGKFTHWADLILPEDY